MPKSIKLFDAAVDNEEERKIKRVLYSGFWASGAGVGNVLTFEKKFQNYVGAKECIALNSGTAALHLALSFCEIRNKEVILPSLSFVSTAHAVLYNGGIPVFADVSQENLCLDPKDVEKKISNKTAAIIPVHFAGMPSDLKKLSGISQDYNALLVEDAAHACGATLYGKKIGGHSPMVCFSFHPVKNLAMPTGGLISINLPNHKQLKQIAAARRWCGITHRTDFSYDVREIGWNFYMNEFSAAIGLAQLAKLDRLNRKRKMIARRYFMKINLDQKMPFYEGCSYHFYWILVKNRTQFRKKMQDAGIETGIHYKPIHKMSMYTNNKSLPVTDEIESHVVSIPVHPNLSMDDVDRIINSVNRFL